MSEPGKRKSDTHHHQIKWSRKIRHCNNDIKSFDRATLKRVRSPGWISWYWYGDTAWRDPHERKEVILSEDVD